jgi:hypothetical protein
MFLADPLAVPAELVDYRAEQLASIFRAARDDMVAS